MMKSSILKKVISSILALSAVCTCGAVSCFALNLPEQDGNNNDNNNNDNARDEYLYYITADIPFEEYLANVPIEWVFWDEV